MEKEQETLNQNQSLKYFKSQDMEMLFTERFIRPEIEQEIRQGFFEIKKKYNDDEFSDKKNAFNFGNDEDV